MTTIITTALESLYLLLPAAIANMAPVFAAKYDWLPQLAKPVDRGTGFLGEHKTIRGFAVGTIAGSATGLLQYTLAANQLIQSISLFNYSHAVAAALFGAYLGFAALLGDAAKSYFKRRLSFSPGSPWHPFDQIDFAAGALLFAWLLVPLTMAHSILGISIFGVLSYVTSYIGTKLRLKQEL